MFFAVTTSLFFHHHHSLKPCEMIFHVCVLFFLLFTIYFFFTFVINFEIFFLLLLFIFNRIAPSGGIAAADCSHYRMHMMRANVAVKINIIYFIHLSWEIVSVVVVVFDFFFVPYDVLITSWNSFDWKNVTCDLHFVFCW